MVLGDDMKIVFMDIETTGLDFDIHVALEIAIVIVDYSNNESRSEYVSCITCDAEDWKRSDLEAFRVNGFNPECLWSGKKCHEVGKEVEIFLIENGVVKDKAFFMCQNPSFDRPFFLQLMSQERMRELNMPYHWLDLASMFWIKYVSSFSVDEVHSLSKDSIARYLDIDPESYPHIAINGVNHLIKCYDEIRKG